MNTDTVDKLKELAIKYVELEQKIISNIIEIEIKYDPNDESSYLDEGQQAELHVLYGLLGRVLHGFEFREIEYMRNSAVLEDENAAHKAWSNAMKSMADRDILKLIQIGAIKNVGGTD